MSLMKYTESTFYIGTVLFTLQRYRLKQLNPIPNKGGFCVKTENEASINRAKKDSNHTS